MSAWASLATVLLPPGEVRFRYRMEFDAELAELRWWQRPAHGLSLVAGGPELHRTLVEAGALDVPHSPLWCRARLHHRWVFHSTDDGARYKRCRQCGLDYDGTRDPRWFGGYAIVSQGHSG